MIHKCHEDYILDTIEKAAPLSCRRVQNCNFDQMTEVTKELSSLINAV